LHIIPDLWTGGAETMLARMIYDSDPSIFEHQVLSLRSIGDIGPELQAAGIKVEALGVQAWSKGILKLHSFRRTLRDYQPHIVHTWLYHANVVGGVAARLWSGAKVVWGLHCGRLDTKQTKYRTRLMRQLGGRLSSFVPDRIICCAHSVEEVHAELGYAGDKLVVIPNGVDVASFHPDARARDQLRAELGIDADQFLVGMVGRHDPQKDYISFLNAAQLALKERPDLRFLLCGRGFETDNDAVNQALDARGLRQHVVRLGFRSDMPRVMASLDALVLSSSYGEAFPLVVIEAMACGVPVIASDIGDIRQMIGRCGIAVPAKSSEQFAAGILHYAGLSAVDYRLVQSDARERVGTLFSLEAAVNRHEALYREVLGRQTAIVPESEIFVPAKLMRQK